MRLLIQQFRNSIWRDTVNVIEFNKIVNAFEQEITSLKAREAFIIEQAKELIDLELHAEFEDRIKI
jgi:hypothetical protein